MASATISLSFNAGDRSREDVEELLDQAGLANPTDSPGMGVFIVTLDAQSSDVEKVRAILQKEKIDWIESRSDEYSKHEIASAPLLIAEIEVEARGHGGPTYGTKYELTQACDRCGTGAIQASNLILKSAEVPKSGDVLRTLDDDVLVSAPFREILEEAQLTGLHIRDVEDVTTGKRLQWSQLLTLSSLPPMAPTTEGLEIENQCPECHRDGHFVDPGGIFSVRYELPDDQLKALPDVVSTWECFGNSVIAEPFEKSHFAQPLLIVRTDLAQLLIDERIGGIDFVPVEAIGADR